MANTISQYQACTVVKSSDQLIINSANVSGNTVTYVTKKATANALFSNVDGIVITKSLTPANSYAVNSVATQTVWVDSNYIYVKTSNTEVKRVALSLF